jgi:hypothetical protein
MATIKWRVEDFRTGKVESGESADVGAAQEAALAVVRDLGRKDLAGVKATIVRHPRSAPPKIMNAKLGERGQIEWVEAVLDA